MSSAHAAAVIELLKNIMANDTDVDQLLGRRIISESHQGLCVRVRGECYHFSMRRRCLC